MKVNYKEKYRFELLKEYKVNIPIRGYTLTHEYFSLDNSGLLTMNAGYNSDGVSGFFQFKFLLRGAFTHDCLYQMIRLKLLPRSRRFNADNILYDILVEDGTPRLLAKLMYYAVRIFGEQYTYPDDSINDFYAP